MSSIQNVNFNTKFQTVTFGSNPASKLVNREAVDCFAETRQSAGMNIVTYLMTKLKRFLPTGNNGEKKLTFYESVLCEKYPLLKKDLEKSYLDSK